MPSDKKLEELMVDEPGDKNFSSKVMQRGQEFLNTNGNLLTIQNLNQGVEIPCGYGNSM